MRKLPFALLVALGIGLILALIWLDLWLATHGIGSSGL